MKTREIGQCATCEWFEDRSKDRDNFYNGVCVLRGPGSNQSNVYQVTKYFGCWYWKVKK